MFAKFKTEEFEFSTLIMVALIFALLAESLDTHFILGAFLAGLFNYLDPTPPEVKYMFSAVVIMALVSTLIAPIVIRLMFGTEKKRE